MTRITILEQKLVQLEEKRKQASIARQNLEEARIDIISRMIHEYFEDVLEEGRCDRGNK
jgi:predicted O-methyltransferase YrrM